MIICRQHIFNWCCCVISMMSNACLQLHAGPYRLYCITHKTTFPIYSVVWFYLFSYLFFEDALLRLWYTSMLLYWWPSVSLCLWTYHLLAWPKLLLYLYLIFLSYQLQCDVSAIKCKSCTLQKCTRQAVSLYLPLLSLHKLFYCLFFWCLLQLECLVKNPFLSRLGQKPAADSYRERNHVN